MPPKALEEDAAPCVFFLTDEKTEGRTNVDEHKNSFGEIKQMRFPYVVDAFLDAPSSVRLPRTWHRGVVIDDDGTVRHDPMRTSKQHRPTRRHGLWNLVQRGVERLVVETVLPPGLCLTEGSFVRYAAGEQYGLHGDAAGMDGGREWTVLVCLQAAEEGGETTVDLPGEDVGVMRLPICVSASATSPRDSRE